MTILIIQILNSLFYAAVLFLVAAGLSLIYGVMRIVNLAHGSLYALGAYVSAWVVGGAVGHAASGALGLAGLLLLLPIGAVAIAAVGAAIEPTLLRPLYRRPEEYHLLITFGLLMILEDAMKFLFGGRLDWFGELGGPGWGIGGRCCIGRAASTAAGAHAFRGSRKDGAGARDQGAEEAVELAGLEDVLYARGFASLGGGDHVAGPGFLRGNWAGDEDHLAHFVGAGCEDEGSAGLGESGEVEEV